jgi:hypothetical protein
MSYVPDWLNTISSVEALVMVSGLLPLAFGVWVLSLVRRRGDDSTVRSQISESLDRLHKMLPERISKGDR